MFPVFVSPKSLKKLNKKLDLALANQDAMMSQLIVMRKEIFTMSAVVDALKAQVAATDGVIASVVVLLNGITARIDELIAELAAQGADTTEIQAAVDDLKLNTESLASAAAAVPPAA